MADDSRFVVLSLELHLFFSRIMKEHSLFLKAGFTPADSSFSDEAELFKQKFEELLYCAVHLSDGVVSRSVLCSGEVITEFTACAEWQTQQFTGIGINQEITAHEACLHHGENPCVSAQLCANVHQLNRNAIELLDGLIALKECILQNVLSCKMFTMNYPLLIEHIIREAKLYRTYVCKLENGMDLDYRNMQQTEQFWNQIMMEHAMFIRGLLDPSENELIETSDTFAKDYARLLSDCRKTLDLSITIDTKASLNETLKFRDFKSAGTKGIQECRIRSVILPLFADHVLREANHYIRLLTDCK